MKKTLKTILLMLLAFSLVFSFVGCEEKSKETSGNEIPNVFGVYYEDAIDILEGEGFEVNAIETSVKSISEKLLYDLESVDKGAVFKIDDYILDNLDNLTLNYEILDDGESMVSKDDSIVIYYAKEDFSDSEDIETDDTESYAEETITKTNTDGISTDFKSAMDSYEKFFDEYVAIMNKYIKNPSDMSILADYTKYIGEYAQMMDEFENWESKDMNSDELAYYIEVQGRITNKLLEIAY